ncbi:hypothetical protein EJV47_24100 [Hymenobacter gummosus]|uniref:Uncharacterized protein n=1 Tax=Hymenobacter gummosus TaxID=1776032 RepID=A0A3S0H1N4_9BACT|nr:hypothetical protein [Hymenobacter gummosus]RTQ45915.1 hypothetical protein EJV47_24100 [Hymenobacter gummosus]
MKTPTRPSWTWTPCSCSAVSCRSALSKTGTEVFLDDVELELGEVQVARLNTIKAGIAQRRAELSA